jgi:sugar phosphate isomerase/epimerase
MRLGAVTYNVLKDWNLETLIKNLEQTGFEAVELRTTHAHGVEPTLSAQERDNVRKLFDRSLVRLLSYGTTVEFHSPDAEERRKQLEIGREFVDLAHDTEALGVKVRPNNLPDGVPREVTVGRIAENLRELGDYAANRGIEIWVEVHGRLTQEPANMASIMRATKHPSVGLVWNSNSTDIVHGSIKPSFHLLRPWVKSVHINELANPAYPWRELFSLLRQSGYQDYMLMEAQESKEPERFLRWYKALWSELARSCVPV